ncbi:hypothetical protein ACH4LT_06720 [Streptomyces clavifer]|uniref:hypothetical protein n=1 Tax=Streptomyces clavifer TaxID=68188 RepID=UPI00378C6001
MVDFERAGNPAWAPALKTGELGVDGVPVTTFAFDITGHGFRDMGCTRQTAVFTNLLKTSVTLALAGITPASEARSSTTSGSGAACWCSARPSPDAGCAGGLSVPSRSLAGMGNSGGSVTVRSTADLRGLMETAGFTDAEDAEDAADGWQVVEVAESQERSVADLVRSTGAPVLLVTYLDSDVGFVEAAAPGGGTWGALLNRAVAEDYDIPLEQFPVERAVRDATAWAHTAGLAPDEDLVRRALTGSAVFAEELASRLLAALGMRAPG